MKESTYPPWNQHSLFSGAMLVLGRALQSEEVTANEPDL